MQPPTQPSSKRPRGLRAPGILGLAALGLAALAPAADAQTQDLFVGNYNSTISRFAGTGPGTFSTTATTITAPSLTYPLGLAFDPRGDLFVVNDNNANTITEFAAGATPGSLGPGTTFATGLNGPYNLVFDKSGNLFVTIFGNGPNGSILEFASTGAGTFGAAMTVETGLNQPVGLAFDASGNLFVANNGGGSNGSITEFAAGTRPGTFGAAMNVVTGLNSPRGLAFDALGDLFLANSANIGNNTSTITEFKAGAMPGTFGATTTLSSPNLLYPLNVVIDARGDVLVGSEYNNILEFPSTGAGTFGAATIIESDPGGPSFVALGPPAVPEASTTVSLGLLLALGMGGLVIAAKRKKTNGKA